MPKKKLKKNTGHWTLGKRRNPDDGWAETLTEVKTLLKNSRQRGLVSVLAIAEHVGVDHKSVRKWVDGATVPTKPRQEKVREWITTVRESLAASSEGSS